MVRHCTDSNECQPIDEFCDPAVDRCSPCAVRCYYATENDKECSGSCPEYYRLYVLGDHYTSTQTQTPLINTDTTINPVDSTSQLPQLFTYGIQQSTDGILAPALIGIILCLVGLVVAGIILGIILVIKLVIKQRRNRLSPDLEGNHGPASKSSSTEDLSTENSQDSLLGGTNQQSQQTASPPHQSELQYINEYDTPGSGNQGPASEASSTGDLSTEDLQNSLLGDTNRQQSQQTASSCQAADQSEQSCPLCIDEIDPTGSGSITIHPVSRQNPSNNDTCYSRNSIADIPSFAMPENLNLKEDTLPKRPDPVDESKLKPGRSIPSTNNCNSSSIRDPMISG